MRSWASARCFRRAVRRAMKNLRPIGIPHSIFLEDLFSKTFDANKLEEDKDRLRNAYQEKGYFRATVAQHSVTMRDTGGEGFRLPLFKPNRPSKYADLRVAVELENPSPKAAEMILPVEKVPVNTSTAPWICPMCEGVGADQPGPDHREEHRAGARADDHVRALAQHVRR